MSEAGSAAEAPTVRVTCRYGHVELKPGCIVYSDDGRTMFWRGGGAIWYDEKGRVVKETSED